MLHILLLILKIIGIILAAILGILVLLVCIVLFVPVRYEIKGKGDGNLESLRGKVRITWLLHLAAVDILYKDQRLRWRLRAAWLKRTGSQGNVPAKVTEPAEESVGENVRETEMLVENEKIIEEVQEDEKTEDKCEEALESKEEVCEETESDEEDCKIEEDAPEERQSISEAVEKFCKKIAAWFQKIKCTFSRLCDKIKSLLEKKDKLAAFIQDEIHVSAFLKVKKELFRYLKRLKPKKADVKVVYGFEDPYRTGQVLAGLSVLYPFIGEYTSITPDFENKIFKGSVYVKGKLYVWHIAALCLRLLLYKNIRTTYKHIKNFEL